MQKKIIALAIAGLSSAAFAQSNVTISGLYDTGFRSAQTEATTGVKTRTTQYGSSSNSATTNVTLAVTEDLGGGMKTGVTLTTEPTAGQSNTNGFANSQSFLWVNGGFGEVKLGYFNHVFHDTMSLMSPFGTALGGANSSAFGRLMGVGSGTSSAAAAVTSGATSAGTRVIRSQNSMQWKSPVFAGGFDVAVMHHGKNADVGVAAADASGETQYSLGYVNGPLNVRYANTKISAGSATSVLGTGGNGTHNIVGANYTFGATTVYGGYTRSEANIGGTRTVDNAAWNVAVKYTMGNWALMANYVTDNDKTATNSDRNLTGLGVDYSLSKRTAAYARYETFDLSRNVVGGKNNTTALGLRHTF